MSDSKKPEAETSDDEATRPVDPPAKDEDDAAAQGPRADKDARGGGVGGEAPDAENGPAWLPLAIAIVTPLLFFFLLPPLTKSGLWDPYELNVADLSRRIALNLHGASALALEATDNSLPHLNDLGRPQLPFTSIALGFKYFGLHEWAGRTPLALWGVLGVVITYGWVSRLIDRRAGLYSAVALTSMPLFFVHARTMLGDIVQMTAFAAIFGGFAVGVFGRRPGEKDTRVAWVVIALLGCLAGFYTRGAFIGVGVPALAIGAAYLINLANDQKLDAVSHGAGALATGIGLAMAFLGLRAIGADKATDSTVVWAGAVLKPPTHYPTFDFIVGHVAPSLAPWSAFAPFAVGRLFATPKAAQSEAFTRESQTRVVLVLGAAIALVAHGWMASRADLITFSAPACIAAICAVALRDYERGAHPSLAVGVGTAVLLGCMHHELHNIPEKAFQAFSVAAGATFPESFKAKSIELWTIALVGFAGISFLTWVERDPEREPFEPKGYLKVVLALRDAWDGMLALGYFAIVAGASLAGLAVWFGSRNHSKWLPTLSSQMRELVLNAWWISAFAPLAIIFAIYFWSDVWVWAFDRAPRRAFGTSLKDRLLAAASRGFEPFEELAARLKENNIRATTWKLLIGRLEVTYEPESFKNGLGPVCLFLLVPLMYLQVPAIVFAVLCYKIQLKWIVSLALAVPSGVALFLFLGFIGEMFRGSRAAFLAVFGVTVGAILCFSYYPALANQLSPKEIFESYQRLHKGSHEPLALFGVGGRTAAYYAGGQPLVLKDTATAYEWLAAAEPGTRRFAAVRSEELPRLNRTYRERTATNQNLPVLDARSSQIILVASSLEDSEKNQNPLNRIVLPSVPKPQKRLDANLEDKLEVIGYDIYDAINNRFVETLGPGKKYHMRTYFKVLQTMQQEWQMFIHIDGQHRRHNGDHAVCEGKYPMAYWLKDDVIMDDHEFTLEPNFSPGPYTLYFGFFIGDSRLKVKSGPGDNENRVNGGTLRVQ